MKVGKTPHSGMIMRASIFTHQEESMPTLTLYDSTRAALQAHLPNVIASQIDALALVIAGAAQSQSAQMAAIARALPLDTTQESKQQRLRRLLDNARIT
jgi:hypothetical protein